jgi:hypothetical protein
MSNPAIDQEITDASTSMEMVREAAKTSDTAMMVTALKDLRKRTNRLLKALNVEPRAPGIDPQLPTEPRLPIRDGA